MLTAAQLAASLGISERQVQRLSAAGMPSLPIGSRGRRYDADECKEWLKGMRCRSNEQNPAGTKFASASEALACTDVFRRAQLRVRHGNSNTNSAIRSSASSEAPLQVIPR